MNQIGSGGYGFGEKHQLLPEKFPGQILSDGKLKNLQCFVRDGCENIKPFPQHTATVKKSIAQMNRSAFPGISSRLLNSESSLLVVFAEMNPLLPDSPQQDVMFLFEQRVYRENSPF